MVISLILMGLGAICVGFFIHGKLTNYSRRTTVIKTVASSMFVILAIYLYFYKEYPPIGIFFIIALFFGLLGDVALGFKRVFPKKDKLFTLLGFVAFASGHIIFDTGLFVCFYQPGHIWVVIIPIAISLIFGSSIILIERILQVNFGKLKIVAFFYITVLVSLSASSLSLAILYSFKSLFLDLMCVGGLLFFISDAILSKTYFGSKPKTVELISCSVTYYLAQFLIAFSLFFL